tara:strand:+ start:787 stop:1473 length:687 start_codon:yes stop_codon:yes gene_type:complete
MPTYTTEAALLAYKVSGSTVDLSAFSTAELEAEIDFIEVIINTYTGTSFYHETDTTYYLDGAGDRTLFFYPKLNIPNISISSILEVDEQDKTLFTFNAATDYHRDMWYVNKTWADRSESRRAMFGGGAEWPKGIRNLKITGAWGYASVPALVTRATILLTLESLLPGSTGLQQTGVEERRWDDYKVRYAQSEDIGPADSTGFVTVDQMLHTYLFRPDMFLTPQVYAPH